MNLQVYERSGRIFSPHYPPFKRLWITSLPDTLQLCACKPGFICEFPLPACAGFGSHTAGEMDLWHIDELMTEGRTHGFLNNAE